MYLSRSAPGVSRPGSQLRIRGEPPILRMMTSGRVVGVHCIIPLPHSLIRGYQDIITSSKLSKFLPVEVVEASNQKLPVSMADALLHHHAAAELLLLRSQTQLLQVGVCAGGRGRGLAPHGWFRGDGGGAWRCRLGLLLEADVRVRVRLLADVQASPEKVSGGGHGGQGGGVAGCGG
ncbi:hypothetical protein EYF80_026185 [Liparis tanakae]|uniref:Uncharacterized protein n=1 Tax=Liparis tanakae TaxID=230148 RepID=A0A4Z2HCU3_9TELE|nr:hypothetical protein EYF80_026185 [Liparis tanakae]